MTTTVKGLLKGIRYISQIFDEDKDHHDMKIGFPTDVKHVAHIGSVDGPAANVPSWMGDFKKSQEMENAQVVSRVDSSNNKIGEGVGLQELLPPPEKPKQKKTRRKSETKSLNGSPPRRNSSVTASDLQPKHSRRHHRNRHGSMDSSNDPSVRRRRVVCDADSDSCPLNLDGSAPTRKSTTRHRKSKGSAGGEHSMKKTKGKTENNSVVQEVDKCNDSTCNKD